MAGLSPELLTFLESSDSPKQVLITVKAHELPSRFGSEPLYSRYAKAAERNRHGLIRALQEEQASDSRVEFNPLGLFNQVALRAPPEVIVRIAQRPDVDEIVPDEPSDVIDDLDG